METTPAGDLKVGLHFCSFQASLDQFDVVFNDWCITPSSRRVRLTKKPVRTRYLILSAASPPWRRSASSLSHPTTRQVLPRLS